MTSLRKAAASAAATTMGLVGVLAWSATPAGAAPPTIGFSSPGDRVTTAGTTVAATVRMTDGRLKKIDLKLTPVGGGTPINASAAGNNGASQEVSFPVNLPLNGRYVAEITATGNDSVLGLGGDTSRKATKEFAVVAPPAAPKGVKVAVNNETRQVAISWTRNTEPDLLFYLVQRSKGGGEFVLSAKTEETTVVDSATAETGGEYAYQVVAVRKGATAEEGVNSNPSTASPASVPAPPAPPTTVAPPVTPGDPPAPGAPPTDTTPTTQDTAPSSTAPSTSTTIARANPGALTRSGSVDLSGLRTLQTQATRPPRSLSPPTTIDPGFTETLPFETTPSDPGESDPQFAEDGLTLDEAAIDDSELGSDDGDVERTRALAFLAAGLLATVLLMHVLWVKGEVARTPLEALPPSPAKKSKRPPSDPRSPGGASGFGRSARSPARQPSGVSVRPGSSSPLASPGPSRRARPPRPTPDVGGRSNRRASRRPQGRENLPVG